MAEYLSVGRMDPHTSMWMRDAALRNDLPSIKKLTTDRYAGLGVLEFWPTQTVRLKYDGLYTAYKIDEQQNQTWYQGLGNWDNGQAAG